jgi:dihydroorotate dehydrogenase
MGAAAAGRDRQPAAAAGAYIVIGAFERLVRPLLHALDPEDAHGLTLRMLKFAPKLPAIDDDKRLAVRAFGLNFRNPVGMAAGFDKNAEVPDALLRLGFGFVEVGTITPKPQAGNPRPRVFRLEADSGVINRLGFNSQGADTVLKRLAARASTGGIVGINVGANKDSADRVADYVQLIERFASVASYVTVNISSPNTPGLRALQQATALDDLLARVVDARERVAPNAGPTPVLLKIAPDLSLAELDDVVGIARSRRVDGMIVGNTTLARPPGLRDTRLAKEAGGLSGRPLLPLATRMLAETYVRVEGVFPLIGAGGIDSGAAALGKVRAGATLLQLYSALVFRGLGLVAEIKAALTAALERDRLERLAELVGTEAASVTAEPWPQ